MKTVVAILIGIVLSTLAAFLAALVTGERNTMKRDSPDFNTMGKLIRLCLGMLVLTLFGIAALAFRFSIFFLLVLIPVAFFGVMGSMASYDQSFGSTNKYFTRRKMEKAKADLHKKVTDQ